MFAQVTFEAIFYSHIVLSTSEEGSLNASAVTAPFLFRIGPHKVSTNEFLSILS